MSSIAVQIVDAVKAKLEETTFGTCVIERHILPEVEKSTDLKANPKIIVTVQGKEIREFDRVNELLDYSIGVALHHPCSEASDYDTAIELCEGIQNHLADPNNMQLTIASGEVSLVLPYEMDAIYDIQMLREANIFFSVTDFTYTHKRKRTT
jgi:hypothetical protein